MIDVTDVKAIALFRLGRGYDNYRVAVRSAEVGDYTTAISKSYYSMFYCANAVLLLGGMSFRRHKDVVAKFTENYVRTGIFDKSLGRLLHKTFDARNDYDYDDFAIPSEDLAHTCITYAKQFYDNVSPYVLSRTRELSNVDLLVYAKVIPELIDKFYEMTPEASRTEDEIDGLIAQFNKKYSSTDEVW